jgi:3-dehydro-L-gulonate 2-dehydrogenase
MTRRIPFEEMLKRFQAVLMKAGFQEERAFLCALLFAESSRDGVASHGLNRFPRFLEYIEKGLVKILAEPTLLQASGSLERWDGNLGPGNLNARASMARAVALAKEHGLGCVALGNTNHWMRGGAYGWQAADSGCIGICWTNTTPNMPPWGAKEAKLGNNPLVIAIPRDGGHIVFDGAMSMFSYGKLESYALQGKTLPAEGGFDAQGKGTRDPAEILESKRVLPIGLWKGSGLSLVLDIVAMFLSGGDSVRRIGQRGFEYGLSQVFICLNAQSLPGGEKAKSEIEEIIRDLRSAEPDELGGKARYPGESSLAVREENLRLGIPVDEKYWRMVLDMPTS